jgi:hypothetical protein
VCAPSSSLSAQADNLKPIRGETTLARLHPAIELAGGVIRRAEITERAEAGDQSRVAITIDYVVKGH